jgi:hypothetical protein
MSSDNRGLASADEETKERVARKGGEAQHDERGLQAADQETRERIARAGGESSGGGAGSSSGNQGQGGGEGRSFAGMSEEERKKNSKQRRTAIKTPARDNNRDDGKSPHLYARMSKTASCLLWTWS